MTRHVPAKTVQVIRYHRAECSWCEWTGSWLDTYQEAATERAAHLEAHRAEDEA